MERFALPIALLLSLSATSGQPQQTVWTGSWAAAPVAAPAATTNASPEGTTYRDIVHLSLGGNAIRLRISNEFGTAPLSVASVHVALSASGAATQTGTDHPVTFGGVETVTVPTGAVIVSDPVPMPVKQFSDLAVSLFVPAPVGNHPHLSLTCNVNELHRYRKRHIGLRPRRRHQSHLMVPAERRGSGCGHQCSLSRSPRRIHLRRLQLHTRQECTLARRPGDKTPSQQSNRRYRRPQRRHRRGTSPARHNRSQRSLASRSRCSRPARRKIRHHRDRHQRHRPHVLSSPRAQEGRSNNRTTHLGLSANRRPSTCTRH